MCRCRGPWCWVLLVASVSAAGAQDVASGPERAKPVPALKVFDATGPNQGQEVDYAAERRDKPTVYIFIQADQWDRPMARFLKKLDEAMSRASGDAFIVAVWLTADVAQTKAYLPLAQRLLALQATALTCFLGAKAGPEGWGLNSDAHLTAVVVHQQKVAATFGYRSLNETDVPAVRDALLKAIKAK